MTAARVVILGAGFAGLGAAQKLKDADVSITLVDQNDYHTFQPLLYQLATDELGQSEVGFPVRDILHHQHNAVFHQVKVTGIDVAGKKVLVEKMDALPYDYLVVALGATVNFYGTKGAAEHAFPMYTLRDAIHLKEHILRTLEATDRNPSLIDDGALTFCVVGGGPTGVEVAGALAEMLHIVAEEDYPNLPIKQKGQIILFDVGQHLLGAFKKRLQDYSLTKLEEMGVVIRLQEGVTEIAANSITLKSGEVIKTHTLVWGAGIQANPMANSLGVQPVKGGRIAVHSDLSLEGHPEIFVVGDIAMITDAKTNEQLPQLGSVAQQAGRHAGETIARLVKGEKTKPFEYFDKGFMATIGRGAAVVQMPVRGTMTGHAAWLAWLGVHVMLLSGGEEKSATMVDWGWNLITKKRGKRIVVSDEDIESENS